MSIPGLTQTADVPNRRFRSFNILDRPLVEAFRSDKAEGGEGETTHSEQLGKTHRLAYDRDSRPADICHR